LKIVECKTSGKYSKIFVGGDLGSLSDYIVPSKTIIITDEKVDELYSGNFPDCRKIVIGTGELNKTLDTVEYIYESLLKYNAVRDTFILGIGGGIVTDVAGFAASTYLRGLKFGFAATTLLSQIDASVGGKNGVNFNTYKNYIGSFNQPEFVICATDLLRSLPMDEIINGLGEAAKHAFIFNCGLDNFLETEYNRIIQLDSSAVERVVYDSVLNKAAVVERDEKETGERRILNFGHTIGHAIESVMKVSHGKAVSIGMVIAAKISNRYNVLSEDRTHRMINILKNLQLPIDIDIDPELIINAVYKDKKRTDDYINFVLLEDIGKPVIKQIELKVLEDIIHDMRKHS